MSPRTDRLSAAVDSYGHREANFRALGTQSRRSRAVVGHRARGFNCIARPC